MKERFLNILSSIEFKIVLFVFAIIYSLNFIFFGLDFTDTFFWINLIPNFNSNPMVSGTLVIGKFWSFIFGDSLISFRILASIMGSMAIILPYVFLIDKKLWVIKLHYLSFSMLLLKNPIFGSDVVTLLVFSIALIFTIKFYQTHKISFVFLMGFITAFSIFVRFPNVLLFPVMIIGIVLIETVNKRSFKGLLLNTIKLTLLFVAIFGISFYLFSLLLHGGVTDYVVGVKSSLLSVSNSSHSMPKMVEFIFVEFKKIVLYLGIFFLLDFLIQIFIKNYSRFGKYITLLFTIILLFYFMYSEIYGSPYDHNLKLFFSSLFFYFILKGVLFKFERQDYNSLTTYLLMISFAFVVPLGSNTGLSKLAPLLICFLPVVLIDFGFKFKENIYLIPLLFIVLFFVFLSYSKPFEDSRIHKLSAIVKTENKLIGIHTTPIRAKYINQVMSDFNHFKATNKIVFFGWQSHLFYYLTKEMPLYKQSFAMSPNDDNDVQFLKRNLKSRPIIFYVTNYPEDKNLFLEMSKLEKMLLTFGYKSIQRDCYKIFTY